jgi:hypothetical protein
MLSSTKYTTYPIKNSDVQNISIEINCSHLIDAGATATTVVGKVSVMLNETELFYVDIITGKKIEKKSMLHYFSSLISEYRSFLP